MNLRKKRNGCPGATAATDLVCYLFCWKKKKPQNCLKAWSAISVQNSPCHNQQVCDISQVNSWLLKILNSTKKNIEFPLKSPKFTLITPHLPGEKRTQGT